MDPSHQDVVHPAGKLAPRMVHHLSGDRRVVGMEPLGQVAVLPDQRVDRRSLGAIVAKQVCHGLRSQPELEPEAAKAFQRRRLPSGKRKLGRGQARARGGRGAAQEPFGVPHYVFRHAPIGGELSARDREHSARSGEHAMLP